MRQLLVLLMKDMTLKKLFAAAAMLAMSTSAVWSKENLGTTTVDGKDYYYYDVQPGETIFSLSRRLGIDREAIEAANPSVADGLKAYMRLYFPVESGVSSIEAPIAGAEVTHKVERGETLYGISKKYGVTVDRIIELNPTARDGVKSGETLRISAPTAEAQEVESHIVADRTLDHMIAPGETLYRIAADNGVTVESLLEVNPGLDVMNYTSGMTIKVPVTASLVPSERRISQSIVRMDDHEVQEAEGQEPAGRADASEEADKQGRTVVPAIPMIGEVVDEATVAKAPAEYKIAIMLPFMLGEEKPSKSAELFTDFYRGFLLAADTLSSNGTPVKIYAFDTANSLDTVKALMTNDMVKEMNLIVGPDDDEQFNAVVDGVDEEKTFVLNVFAVKNESFKDHQNVIQTNIPHTMMYDKAMDAFMEAYKGRRPVFVSRINGAGDKGEFTTALKSRLSDRGVGFDEIVFKEVLAEDDFEKLSADSAYVFVPVSGTRGEFVKIAPALKRFNETMGGVEGVAIFGYPEWVTFRGDMLETLGDLNASIYSRFYDDQQDYRSRRVRDNFRRWYGREMIDAVPSQGLLGFDTGLYAIKALRANEGDFHLKDFDMDGLQSNFMMDDSDVDGLVNTSLMMINFKPGGASDRRKI